MMPISQTIADFTGALDAARAELASVNGQISDLQAERVRVLSAPPHTDDIIALFKRGVRQACETFQLQLGASLNATFVGPDGAAAVASQRSSQLLRLEERKPDREELMTRSMKGQAAPDLNIAALTYFLRDPINAEIPALVDKFCPDARDGMKQVDRDRAVREIDDQIASLRVERERLEADLGAARAAVSRS